MKKQPWTLEKHQEVGRTLHAMHDDLIRIMVELSESYPNTTGNSGRAQYQLDKALRRINVARSVMEDLFMAEPAAKNMGRDSISVYYPGNRKE